MQAPHPFLDKWIKEHLFDAVPMGIAVIDQAYNLVYANRSFEKMFGAWRFQKCYTVYKRRETICNECKGSHAFRDGKPRVTQDVGVNRAGELTRYIKHTLPVVDDDGDIPFLIEMCIDITEAEQIRREYELLFDQVPCNILLIDRNFKIVKTNRRFKELLGKLEGGYCYEALKGLDQKCAECTSSQTFADGQMHTGHHVWKLKDGNTMQLHVITVPLLMEDGSFDMVMEMAVDITQTIQLEEGLRFAHSFLETMVKTSIDGILAVDGAGNVPIVNPAARKLFDIGDQKKLAKNDLAQMLPPGFLEQVLTGPAHVYLPEAQIKNFDGQSLPVRLVGNQLLMDGESQGLAVSIQDLREIKKLENAKLEAERMAAVGQTVAGLAHGVKNLITSLEGGMYMLKSGFSKNKLDRVEKGLGMLDRNIDRISVFVRSFLSFAKGREIKVKMNDPAAIATEVVDSYAVQAKGLGIDLKHKQNGTVSIAPIDYESMHECLTNLVGNAIDACRMSDHTESCHVTVRTFEKDETIHYEVIDDGCGMDYEVKRKVFTTFFTTKGLGGTGLGLLMTQKIIQEHGGKIDMASEPGKGTTFTISLPRQRLPEVISNDDGQKTDTN
jgi:PAS domain S-box-containing protein